MAKGKRKTTGDTNPLQAIGSTVEGERKRSSKCGTKIRPWSDLLPDILRLIVQRLYLGDRIRFQAVCKGWLHLPITDIQPIEELPWIMNYAFTPTSSVCALFEPSRRLPHINRSKSDLRKPSKLFLAKVCASRAGWALFSKKAKEPVKFTSYFVYNPLSKEIISLPNLKWPYCNDVATFSSAPTSSDCVFFVPHHYKDGRVFISTYSIGNIEWKTWEFSASHRPIQSSGVVYLDGRQSMVGELTCFNIATQECKSLKRYLSWINFPRPPSHFLVYGGHLCVRWKAWKVSIVSRVISFGISAGEQTRMIANGVYYFSSNTPKFFTYGPASLGTKSASRVYRIPKVNDDSNESRIWIEPPPVKYS
ncbi:F-box/kelch-repeat protein [Vitis vinifera]|uniref:F-box/kelch-repeat protein n=1 Tax=Vitis vinifera TaxID=29760 RepID=A0A438F082_VITVI|nr:F-box/kelch-repeat protein [Vitis vinifera]